jgi:hypothetical protein
VGERVEVEADDVLCQHAAFTLASVYREQRDLVALAAGRPTFQWIEASAIDGHCGATPPRSAAR